MTTKIQEDQQLPLSGARSSQLRHATGLNGVQHAGSAFEDGRKITFLPCDLPDIQRRGGQEWGADAEADDYGEGGTLGSKHKQVGSFIRRSFSLSAVSVVWCGCTLLRKSFHMTPPLL